MQKNVTSSPDLSRGVAKNGQEIGIKNELIMLECILAQGWIREYELHLITGMSMYTAGQVGRRLVTKNQIYRERIDGNAGYFLRLLAAGAKRIGGKSGKDICIPDSWPHHALAIQTLHHLATALDCEFETEAILRHRIQSGKLPDGRLISDTGSYYFEQERSRKSGANLRKQTEIITNLAAAGTTCFVAYPYPAKLCGGIDHETRQINSIRHKWGSLAAPNIKLVRCHFNSLIEYQNMHVSRFEIIDLPAMVKTTASQKYQPGMTDQVKGFNWAMQNHNDQYANRIDAILRHDGEICFRGTFIEADSGDDFHAMETDGFVSAQAPADEYTFGEFVQDQQKEIEKQIKVAGR